MALMKCPECGREVSTSALSCPGCGYPLQSMHPRKPVRYEHKIVKFRCLGRGQEAINKKLAPYTSEGWEVVSMTEDRWQGGLLSPVYEVTLKRAIK